MRIDSLSVDYGEFIAAVNDLLAVGDGLLHVHPAPAMSAGMAGFRGSWHFPAARDPLWSLVGARFASVGKDPPRRSHVAVRVAPAMLDLRRAGVLSAAGLFP
jgi:hypothetical protein